jgi:hypothetical protein
MKCNFNATIQEEGTLDSMVTWYQEKHISLLGMMLLKDEDLTKILVIELKSVSLNGAKFLMSCVTLVCHRI